VTYTLTVTNRGPDAAANVRVSDRLPSGLTLISASPGCSAGDAAVTCAADSLAAGAAQTFTITAGVASSVSQSVTNEATVTSDTADPDAASNTATVTLATAGTTDLSIAKRGSTTTLGPDGQVLYTLVVKNDGPSDATGVSVTDLLPAGLVPESANPAQGACAIAGGRVSCSLGALAAGGATQVLVTARTSGEATGSLTDTASVAGQQHDPDLGDNTATATVTVLSPPPPPQDQAALSISKRASRAELALGRPITYRIVVTNSGQATATDARVTDTKSLPGRLLAIATSAGTCTRTAPVSCALGTITAGASVTITARFRPTATGTLRNAASVTSHEADPATSNNLAVVATRVRLPLRLTKHADRRAINAGQTVTYTIRVRNPTRRAVHDVRTCDRLPPGLRYVSATPRATTMSGRFCWTAGRLGAHRSRTYRLTTRAQRRTSGTKTNHAVATSPDAATARARRSIRVTPRPIPGLRFTG
jgi:uncharacterized repeat protein (TIGR01451 family)